MIIRKILRQLYRQLCLLWVDRAFEIKVALPDAC